MAIVNKVRQRPNECPWVSVIKNRIKKNKNFVCAITGKPGTGKTWTAIAKAVQIDPDFDVSQQLFFEVPDMMEVIEKFNDPNHELSKRKYKVMVLDEPQYSLSNRKWQSDFNQAFNDVLSTFRHQNIIMIMATSMKIISMASLSQKHLSKS